MVILVMVMFEIARYVVGHVRIAMVISWSFHGHFMVNLALLGHFMVIFEIAQLFFGHFRIAMVISWSFPGQFMVILWSF